MPGWTLGMYRGTLRRAILRWKVGADGGLGELLAILLARQLKTVWMTVRPDVIVAVPSDRRRTRWKTATTPEDLARWTGQYLSINHAPGCLRKTRSTRPQRVLTQHERRHNLQGVFRVVKPTAVRDRRVLIVDDIMTTGSTLNEARRALRAAGAVDVWWCALAARQLLGRHTS